MLPDLVRQCKRGDGKCIRFYTVIFYDGCLANLDVFVFAPTSQSYSNSLVSAILSPMVGLSDPTLDGLYFIKLPVISLSFAPVSASAISKVLLKVLYTLGKPLRNETSVLPLLKYRTW